MKIVSVAGTKNTGKTTMVTRVVNALVNRGFKVGTVKHTLRSLDIEEKDTWKHLKSGAEIVVGAGKETFFVIDESMELEEIIKTIEFMKDLDFLVLEGFKTHPYAKIATASLEDPYVIAQVDVRELDQAALETMVDMVQERSYGMLANMNCKECGFDSCLEMAQAVVKGKVSEEVCVMKKSAAVEITVDGKRVPLNPFVQKFVKSTLMAC
jgi:molybdopterin-guanine dinucleotide biosynthesis protein B